MQIYEAILGDTEGQVTTILLKGAGYLKDNRLPPSGFDKTLVQEESAVHGAALDDKDFAGGVDQIHYSIDLGDAEGRFTVTAELLFQPISFRWADNLRAHDAPEPARFLDDYGGVPNQPVVIDTATTEMQP